MEIDGDIEGDLARVLSCMGTNDKEALIKQFIQLLGHNAPTPDAAHFFLDMSNWNLQTALGNFYDYGATANVSEMFEAAALNMQLVNDVTIGEGEAVPPQTRFTKTWRVRNNGLVAWPFGTQLLFCEGTLLANKTSQMVKTAEAGEEVDISVEMFSPTEPGVYQSRWHLTTLHNAPFGESIWCIVTVDANGILDITQQLASAPLADRTRPALFGGALYNPPAPSPAPVNPFHLGGHEVENMPDDLADIELVAMPQGSAHFEFVFPRANANPLSIAQFPAPRDPQHEAKQ